MRLPTHSGNIDLTTALLALLLVVFTGGCAYAYEHVKDEPLIDPGAVSDKVDVLLAVVDGKVRLINPRTGMPADLCRLAPADSDESDDESSSRSKEFQELPACVASEPVIVRDLLIANLLQHEGSHCYLKRKDPPPFGPAVYEQVCTSANHRR
jgi:hypothetical protein